MLLLPSSEEEAADLIKDHASRGEAMAVYGGNTRSGFGNAVKADTALSARVLSGIVAYNPGEMVMTALAGTPVSDIEAALAENRQMMAFEPPDHRPMMGTSGAPTIGGVFAANASGSRRMTAGAARDSLLGVRFVNGRGEIIKAGGRVMKNVTGLDLVKLMAGSHGTLGLLTEVTFRVPPVPRTEKTLVISGLDDERATTAMAAAMALSTEVSCAAHLPLTSTWSFLSGDLPEGPATILRVEGLPDSVKVRIDKLAAAMTVFGRTTQIDVDHSRRLWREVRDIRPFADDTMWPVWRVSVAPGVGQRLVASLRLEAAVDAFYDWQGGLVWIRMQAETDGVLLRRHVAAVGGGHVTLLRADGTARAGTSAFHPQSAAVALLSGRLKEKFDPANIFNPGKMG